MPVKNAPAVAEMHCGGFYFLFLRYTVYYMTEKSSDKIKEMSYYLPFFSAILAIFSFNTAWNFLILVALAPLFWFLIQEQKIWKLLAGTALFRLIFKLGTIYFVIDPILYFLSILIFLGLPISFYLIRRYWSSELAAPLLPILWIFWDYIEAQYAALPMTITMAGNALGNSPFLGLAKFDGIIGLTLFVALVNIFITFGWLEINGSRIKRLIYFAVAILIVILS